MSGPPDPAPDLPVRGGQILGRPAAAHFHHGHAVALLGEAMRGHAASEAGADHDEVEVRVGIRHGVLHGVTRFPRPASAGANGLAARGQPGGEAGNFEPRFQHRLAHGSQRVAQRFLRIDAQQHGAERARHRSEFVAQGDGFRLHVDAFVRFRKTPVGIEPPQVAVVLAHFARRAWSMNGSASGAGRRAPTPRRSPRR